MTRATVRAGRLLPHARERRELRPGGRGLVWRLRLGWSSGAEAVFPDGIPRGANVQKLESKVGKSLEKTRTTCANLVDLAKCCEHVIFKR